MPRINSHILRSISRKISAQYGNDDEIDFSDLNFEDDPAASSAAAASGQDTGSDSDLSVGGGPRSGRDRRESRGVSQVGVTPRRAARIVTAAGNFAGFSGIIFGCSNFPVGPDTAAGNLFLSNAPD